MRCGIWLHLANSSFQQTSGAGPGSQVEPSIFSSGSLSLDVASALESKSNQTLVQGQARGYGHITQQYLIFGRTTGGQHFQLEYLQRYLKNCFASFIL